MTYLHMSLVTFGTPLFILIHLKELLLHNFQNTFPFAKIILKAVVNIQVHEASISERNRIHLNLSSERLWPRGMNFLLFPWKHLEILLLPYTYLFFFLVAKSG